MKKNAETDWKILNVGITGGIGSGKTTVCSIFETLGIPIYSTDERAKEIVVEDEELKEKMKALFGKEAYLEDGALNRAYISNIVFQNKTKDSNPKLEALNAIIHPAIWRDGERWFKAQKNVPYTLKESALLFESGGYKLLDKVITVFAPQEVRINRVILRGGITTKREEVEARMNQQMPDEEKIKLADFVIYNDGKQALIPQVMKIHNSLSIDLAAR